MEWGRDVVVRGPTGVRPDSVPRIQAPLVRADRGGNWGCMGAVSWNRMDGELHVGWEVLGREHCVPMWREEREVEKAGLGGWGES